MLKSRWLVILFWVFIMAGVLHDNPVMASPEDATYQTLPFNQDWSNTGLITTVDDWSGVSGIQGFRGDGLTAVNDVDPQTVLGPDTPGVLDVNANQTNPNTFTTGGVTEFDIADDVVALTGSGTADAPYLVLYLNTTDWKNIRVTYNVRDLDGSEDNAVQQLALHYRVGESGNFTNVPAAYIADATTGPSLATLVTPIDVTLPAAVDDQSQVQLRIMTTNAAGNDEWIGIDDITVTGDPISPFHTITLDGSINEWSAFERLGSVNFTDFYLTWDDDFWYFGIEGGFSDLDFFMLGIDVDPTDETTNTGGTAERCGMVFPTENKPDYILANRQNSYVRESWGWTGSAWDQGAWNPAETSEYDFSGGGGDYEVKLKKSTVFASDEDTSPVAFYFWLANSICQPFNAWPPENHNGWTGGTQFLFAHTRFAATDDGRVPSTDGQRVGWSANTLSSDSTVYNYFGGDDISAGNPWLRLTTTGTGAGGASCTVRAKVVGINALAPASFTGINRYVDFTLTNCTNLEVDVQIRYEETERNGIDEANTQFYHCPSPSCTGWTAVAGGSYTRDATNNNLLLTNVPQTEFSFWTISDTDTPTALTLHHLTALSQPGNEWAVFLALLVLAGLAGFAWVRNRRRTQG